MIPSRRSCPGPRAGYSEGGCRPGRLGNAVLGVSGLGLHLHLLLVAAMCAPLGMAERPIRAGPAAFCSAAGPIGHKVCTGFSAMGNGALRRQRGGLPPSRVTMLGGGSSSGGGGGRQVDGPLRQQAHASLLPSSPPPSPIQSLLSQGGSRIGARGLTVAHLSGKSGGGGDPVKTQQLRTRLKALKVAECRALLKQFGTTEDPKLKKAQVIERIIELTETNGAPFVKPKEELPTPPPPSPSPSPSPVFSAQTQTQGRTPSPEVQARAASSTPPPSSPPPATRTPAAAAGRNDEHERRGASLAVQGRREWGEGESPRQRRDADPERRDAPRQKWSVTRGGTTTQGRMAGKASEQQPARRGQQGSRGGVGNGARLPASASELSEADMASLYRGDREEDYRPVTGTGSRGARDNTADLELCFLGTASCLPSLTRGVSSIAMRMSGKAGGSSFWIFDAGEATQIQVQKSWIRPSSIDRIFITHLHGDHSFGIVGLMCLIGQDRPPERGPLEIFGPQGLRNMIRVTLQLSRSRAVPPYRVTELIGVPYLHGRYGRKPESECDRMKVPRDWRYKEVDDGDDIYASEDGLWHIPEFNGFHVVAGPMQHTMMCVGYVVQEKRGTDRLKMDAVEDIVERNKDGLREMIGRNYKSVYKDIKAMKPGETFEMPDGHIIRAEDVLVPARPGRKIVILGDTCDARSLVEEAYGADIVVHEATNAFIPGIDTNSEREVQKDAISHGHSTPQMAGQFARMCDAKQLILTHFSPRYRSDNSEYSRTCMRYIEQYARDTSGLEGSEVKAAYDLMSVTLDRPGYEGGVSSDLTELSETTSE